MKIKHRHKNYEDRMSELDDKIIKLGDFLRKPKPPTINIYSSGNNICVGMHHKLWHRIVCKYDGNICIGTPNPHWISFWEFDIKGFSLEGFLNEEWKGWHGQYSKSELRYDQLDFKLVKQHSDEMHRYLKEDFGLYFPCHIYDDINSVMHRP